MTNACEFILNGATIGVQGVYHVIGRCGDLPISVGDVFDQVRQPEGHIEKAQLKVRRIEAYQRELAAISPGLTAQLDVEGQGVESLKPRSVLVASHPISPEVAQSSAETQSQYTG